MGLRITNAATQKPVLWLYGVIGGHLGGITPEEMRNALNSLNSKQDIELRIHSEGGSYVDSIAMQSNLRRREGQVHVVIDGLAASGGSIVAMGGDTIEMAEGAYMMIHEARGGASNATAADMRNYADMLDSTNNELVKIYSTRWKGSEKELREALDAETWLNPESAIELGLADTKSSQEALVAHVDAEKFHYNKVPQVFLDATETTIDQFPLLNKAEKVLAELFPEEPQEKDEECVTK